MVPAPPHGGRDLRRNAPSEDGSAVPVMSLDMEIKKGKGLASAPESLIYGEGSSELKKEETTKQETRRT